MKPLRLILVFALLQCVIAFLTVSGSFTHEESMWHYIGRNWFRLGLTPYDGGVDNKSPLIFAVFGLSDYLFGLNFWFPRLLGIVCQSVGIYYLYKIAVYIAGPAQNRSSNQVGIVTITIYALSLLWRGTGGKQVSFTETYAITFLLIAIYYYLRDMNMSNANERRSLFLSGLMAGIALGWRISAAFGISAIVIHSIAKRKTALVPFITGLIGGVVALAMIAMMAGIALEDIYLFAFAENFGAGSTTDHSLGWKLDSFVSGFFYSELVVFYPFIAVYFLLKKKLNLPGIVTSLLTIWLICEFIGINVPGIYARPHFKHLLPAMSLMSGIAIVHIMNTYAISMKHVLIAVWILFIPKVTEPLYAVTLRESQYQFFYTSCAPPYYSSETAQEYLGVWIRENTKKNDRVLVAGFGARVQLYSQRLSPTIYFNVTQTPRAKAQLAREINANKPAMILIPLSPNYKVHVQEDLRALIDSLAMWGYTKEHQCLFGYTVYRVNSSPNPAKPVAVDQ